MICVFVYNYLCKQTFTCHAFFQKAPRQRCCDNGGVGIIYGNDIFGADILCYIYLSGIIIENFGYFVTYFLKSSYIYFRLQNDNLAPKMIRQFHTTGMCLWRI